MFLGYAMMDGPKDLERFLVVNIVVGSVIAGLGIAQSVLGINFLTPEESAVDLYQLSHVVRFSPITHEGVLATSSVFVSAGRFSSYLIMLWILVFDPLAYFLPTRPRAKYRFMAILIT